VTTSCRAPPLGTPLRAVRAVAAAEVEEVKGGRRRREGEGRAA
jgi:hypothetical protein